MTPKPRHRVIIKYAGQRWMVWCRAPGTGAAAGRFVWFTGVGQTQHQAWAHLWSKAEERARAVAGGSEPAS
jgi:hypothetical protein